MARLSGDLHLAQRGNGLGHYLLYAATLHVVNLDKTHKPPAHAQRAFVHGASHASSRKIEIPLLVPIAPNLRGQDVFFALNLPERLSQDGLGLCETVKRRGIDEVNPMLDGDR